MRPRRLVLASIVCWAATWTPGAAAEPVARDVPGMAGLLDVWCRTDGTCIGVGRTSGDVGAVVVSANGQTGPVRAIRNTTSLSGITCHQTGCVAVGKGQAGGVVVGVGLDGTPQGIRSVAGSHELFAVACPTSSTCLATGSVLNTQQPAHFYPTTFPVFTVVSGGEPSPARPFSRGTSHMVGIACPTATRCLAAGGSAIGVLTEAGGSWSATTTFVSGPTGTGRPTEAIACGSATVCYTTAVGFIAGSEGYIGVPAVMPVTSAGVPGPVQLLDSRSGTASDISCVAAHTCTVVGQDNLAMQGLVIDLVRGLPVAVSRSPRVDAFVGVSCVGSATCGLAGNRVGAAVFAWHGPVPG